MKDVLMLVLITVFFVLCIAYVSWCDRIIGPDPAEASPDITEHNVAGRVADEVSERVTGS